MRGGKMKDYMTPQPTIWFNHNCRLYILDCKYGTYKFASLNDLKRFVNKHKCLHKYKKLCKGIERFIKKIKGGTNGKTV